MQRIDKLSTTLTDNYSMNKLISPHGVALASSTVLISSILSLLSAPVMAQQRTCIESQSGRTICGDRVPDVICIESDRSNQVVCGRATNDPFYRDRDRDTPSFNSGFDEDFYLKAYADVAAAVAQGRFKNGYEHYRRVGRFEGRYPRFNEPSYLSKNPDVARAIQQKKWKNGYDHWLRYGRFENRQL